MTNTTNETVEARIARLAAQDRAARKAQARRNARILGAKLILRGTTADLSKAAR